MATETTSTQALDGATIKELGRRRVFAFFWVFTLVAIANTINEENDILLHVVDDYTDIVLAVVAIVVLLLWWKRASFKNLRRGNNILTVLAVLLIVATLYAVTQEMGDPTDFGNEIPTIFFGVFMILNRFL